MVKDVSICLREEPFHMAVKCSFSHVKMMLLDAVSIRADLDLFQVLVMKFLVYYP